MFSGEKAFKTSDHPLSRISALEHGREYETEIDWTATVKSLEFLKMPVSILRDFDPEAKLPLVFCIYDHWHIMFL